MPALNRIELIGYLGKDPEARFTPTGKKVCTFSVAVNRWKSSDSDAKDTTDWFNVETWGKTADYCEAYLKKGNLVFVEGRLQIDRSEKNGETRYYTKVVANRIENLERKSAEVGGVEEDASDMDFAPF